MTILSQHGDSLISRWAGRMGVLAASMLLAQVACGPQAPRSATEAERKQIADSIRAMVVEAYDFSRPDVVQRLMTMYPDSGPVYSTSSGHVATTRAELQQQIQTFWKYVGSNMRNPKWEWTSMHIDVLAPDAAVLTASYRVPHLTPQNTPHVIAGAWTAALVKRDGRWVVIQEHLSDTPAAAAAAAPAQSSDHSGH